ncbi:helix-turn-helix domain-containing protein [Treponema zioleckii]|uniref:helix-turn-helix domain-containing protein n=1 Tax=Treponema zioleckii TaxID=331680 RepID=UPI00168BB5BC|nr:helix-turn-helix transcriptional regulator [Treponema zioleckii]
MKFYRKKEGLSQAALAEKAGTAANYIALIEVGKNFPSLQMLEKIALALNVDALDLFDKNGFSLIDGETLQQNLIESIEEVVREQFSGCVLVRNL